MLFRFTKRVVLVCSQFPFAFASFGVLRSVFGIDSMIRSAVLDFDMNTCFREVSGVISFNKVLCFG